MPDPPHVGFITRFVLENPWPLGGGLVAIGLAVTWLSVREGRLGRAKGALVPVVIGAAVLAAGFAVTTSGERARGVVGDFVDHVVAGDIVAASNLLAPGVSLHIGAETNVGRDYDFLVDGLSRFDERYTVESNSVGELKGYTTSGDDATVHLACMTRVAEGMGYPTATRWVLRVSRQDDGRWLIDRMVFVSLNGQAAPGDW
jgi:hypothetical protein